MNLEPVTLQCPRQETVDSTSDCVTHWRFVVPALAVSAIRRIVVEESTLFGDRHIRIQLLVDREFRRIRHYRVFFDAELGLTATDALHDRARAARTANLEERMIHFADVAQSLTAAICIAGRIVVLARHIVSSTLNSPPLIIAESNP